MVVNPFYECLPEVGIEWMTPYQLEFLETEKWKLFYWGLKKKLRYVRGGVSYIGDWCTFYTILLTSTVISHRHWYMMTKAFSDDPTTLDSIKNLLSK